jgi:uncharacterized membrane protein
MHAFGAAGGLAWLVLIGLIVAGVIVLVVMLTRTKATGSAATPAAQAQALTAAPYGTALSMAAERYATGAITKEQLEEIRDTLGAIA